MGNLMGVSRRIQIIQIKHSAFSKLVSNTNKKTLFKVLLVRLYVGKISINRARLQKNVRPMIRTIGHGILQLSNPMLSHSSYQ
jgi:hypothetical protein